MPTSYTTEAWKRVDEAVLIDCIERIYSQKDFLTKNYHRDDRIHEKGIDLYCRKNEERIAFAVKKKPGTKDIKQLKEFVGSTVGMRSIYVHVHPPTRPFEQALKEVHESIETWDSLRLHKELTVNECIPYICLYFSGHPVVESLTKSYKTVYDKRNSKYSPHKMTSEEASVLWLVKDNVVKMRTALLQTYQRTSRLLMDVTEKRPKDYQRLLDSTFVDLDIVNDIAGEKIVSSFQRLSEEFPSLLGLYWRLASHRTEWGKLTRALENLSEDCVEDHIVFNKVLPNLVFGRFAGVMRGFYSTVNYILRNFHQAAKELEYGVDWVFRELRRT